MVNRKFSVRIYEENKKILFSTDGTKKEIFVNIDKNKDLIKNIFNGKKSDVSNIKQTFDKITSNKKWVDSQSITINEYKMIVNEITTNVGYNNHHENIQEKRRLAYENIVIRGKELIKEFYAILPIIYQSDEFKQVVNKNIQLEQHPLLKHKIKIKLNPFDFFGIQFQMVNNYIEPTEQFLKNKSDGNKNKKTEYFILQANKILAKVCK